MKKLFSQQVQTFQAKIFDWYAQKKRDFPWRHTHDPYRILVSEVMSQQTQIARVIPKYEAWITRFPDIFSLARATNAEVLEYWSGLGYNRRALFLQKCGKEIVEKYKGEFPQSEKELLSLPGIGIYTARAILSFAFKQSVAVMDVNVKKVILLEIVKNPDKIISDKELRQIADDILPKEKAYDWNQALMDYSAAILKKEKIPRKKQATFKGSNRYFRGGVMRLLIKYKYLSREDLHRLLLTDEKKEIESSKFSEILESLIKDGLVKYDSRTRLHTL